MAKSEHEIADATAVDMMAVNVEACVGFQQGFEHANSFDCRGGDDLCMEGSVTAGDGGIEYPSSESRANVGGLSSGFVAKCSGK